MKIYTTLKETAFYNPFNNAIFINVKLCHPRYEFLKIYCVNHELDHYENHNKDRSELVKVLNDILIDYKDVLTRTREISHEFAIYNSDRIKSPIEADKIENIKNIKSITPYYVVLMIFYKIITSPLIFLCILRSLVYNLIDIGLNKSIVIIGLSLLLTKIIVDIIKGLVSIIPK